MKFLIGLLLGLILGIAGASGFLITAGGGDYFVGASPRVRELEASLREADKEREWLRGRLSEATQLANRLESRFLGLAARFETLADETGHPETVGTAQAPRASASAPAAGARAKPAPLPAVAPSKPAPTKPVASEPAPVAAPSPAP